MLALNFQGKFLFASSNSQLQAERLKSSRSGCWDDDDDGDDKRK